MADKPNKLASVLGHAFGLSILCPIWLLGFYGHYEAAILGTIIIVFVAWNRVEQAESREEDARKGRDRAQYLAEYKARHNIK